MRLDLIEREYEAIELIKRGMRISVVSRITEFSPKVLRSLSREVHGHSPDLTAAFHQPHAVETIHTSDRHPVHRALSGAGWQWNLRCDCARPPARGA